MTSFKEPVMAFDAAIDALQRRDVNAFAECFDPISLDQVKRQTLEGLRRELPGITVEEFMRNDPNMPREMAEYQVAYMRMHANPAARLKQDFPTATSIADLEAMTPAMLYFAWLEGRGMRRQLEELVNLGRVPPEVLENFREPRPVSIGSVQANDRVAWVVYRDDFGEFQPSDEWMREFPEAEKAMAIELAQAGHPRLHTCYRQPDGSWKLVADHIGLGSTGMAIGVAAPPEKQE